MNKKWEVKIEYAWFDLRTEVQWKDFLQSTGITDNTNLSTTNEQYAQNHLLTMGSMNTHSQNLTKILSSRSGWICWVTDLPSSSLLPADKIQKQFDLQLLRRLLSLHTSPHSPSRWPVCNIASSNRTGWCINRSHTYNQPDNVYRFTHKKNKHQ